MWDDSKFFPRSHFASQKRCILLSYKRFLAYIMLIFGGVNNFSIYGVKQGNTEKQKNTSYIETCEAGFLLWTDTPIKIRV